MKKLRVIQEPAKSTNTKDSMRLWSVFWSNPESVCLFSKGWSGGYLHWGHMEMMRLTISRRMDHSTIFAVWCIKALYKPITRKGLGQCMGGGTGAIDHMWLRWNAAGRWWRSHWAGWGGGCAQRSGQEASFSSQGLFRVDLVSNFLFMLFHNQLFLQNDVAIKWIRKVLCNIYLEDELCVFYFCLFSVLNPFVVLDHFRPENVTFSFFF